jgi:tripartite motif-containing protein 71
VSDNSTKKRSILNYSVWYKLSILFLISTTLVCSSLHLSPSAFSSNGTFITKWGGDYSGRDGKMRSPAGITLDQEGNVYVADTGNNRIQVFSSNGTFITKWGDVTKWGEYGSGNSTMRSPQGIAVDSSSGNVYVADTGINYISVWTLS